MTTAVHYEAVNGYQIGLSFKPGQATLSQLTGLLSSSNTCHRAQNTLGGRRDVAMADLSEIGPVVIKAYARGGLIHYINKEHYLRLGKARCQLEFEFMQKAGTAGVSVPEPIGFASRGGLVYKAWLITRAVLRHQTFAAVCQTDADRARALMPAITNNICKLVAAKIHHVDLHPGNILIDETGTPYIIDFDRAHWFSGSTTRLWEKHKKRWDRAIEKHDLPLFAKAVFEKHLFQ